MISIISLNQHCLHQYNLTNNKWLPDSSKNYNWFLFFYICDYFLWFNTGYYNDHFSYALSLLAVYLFLKKKRKNFLVLFIVGVIFSTFFSRLVLV